MDVGIIGGQDGPTVTLVGGDPIGFLLMLLTVVGIIGVSVWLFQRKRKK